MNKKSLYFLIIVLVITLFATFIWPTKHQYLGEVHIFGKIPALARKNRLTNEIQFLYLVPKLFGRWRELPQMDAQPNKITIALYDSLISRLQNIPQERRDERCEDVFVLSPEDRRGLIESFNGK